MIWNRDVNAAINMVTIGKSVIMSDEKPRLFAIRLPKAENRLVAKTRQAEVECTV